MTTERLFELVVLSQTLNYSRAAKKLFITQSVLSRHIKELEKELGTTLLNRSTHGVRLTEAGRAVVQGARGILQKYDAAVSRLRTAGPEASGFVSISWDESAVCDQLLVFIRQFHQKYPGIDFKVDAAASAEQFPQLDRYDFFFSGFELQNLPRHIQSRLAFRHLGALAVMHGHQFLYRHHLDLKELAGETLIVPYADETFCSYSANRQLAEKLTGNRLSILKVPSPESALVMAALGRGVAIVPQHLAATTLGGALGNTVLVNITTPGCVFDTYLYWNRASENDATRLFYEEFEAFVNMENE